MQTKSLKRTLQCVQHSINLLVHYRNLFNTLHKTSRDLCIFNKLISTFDAFSAKFSCITRVIRINDDFFFIEKKNIYKHFHFLIIIIKTFFRMLNMKRCSSISKIIKFSSRIAKLYICKKKKSGKIIYVIQNVYAAR